LTWFIFFALIERKTNFLFR